MTCRHALRELALVVPAPEFGPCSVSGTGPWRWAYCPEDWLLHLLHPKEVAVALTGKPARARCGRCIPPAGFTLADNGALPGMCESCVAACELRSASCARR